jgi:RNA polymerase sigma factor (TIGR02999 family)
VTATPGEITQILRDFKRDQLAAQDRLIPLVYRELRRIAAAHLRRENAGHSLQPTALVHEAYLRLVDVNRIDWQSRAHFFCIASTEMRRVLVDHARARDASKRGGGASNLQFDEALFLAPGQPPEIIALDDALNRLALLDGRQAKIVEMRFFGGMTEEEAGDVLGISVRTVKRDWRMAKAWLFKELST